jgi:hypothetical protein
MKHLYPLLSTANRQRYLQLPPARSTLGRPLWGNPGGSDPDFLFILQLPPILAILLSSLSSCSSSFTNPITFDLLYLTPCSASITTNHILFTIYHPSFSRTVYGTIHGRCTNITILQANYGPNLSKSGVITQPSVHVRTIISIALYPPKNSSLYPHSSTPTFRVITRYVVRSKGCWNRRLLRSEATKSSQSQKMVCYPGPLPSRG